MKIRLILIAILVAAMLVLNLIPSKPRVMRTEENAAVSNGPACTIQNWGFPMNLYSHYGGGGYISPYNMDPMNAVVIYSDWHLIGLIFNSLLMLGVIAIIWKFRLPGLMGEGQENIPIVRDSEKDE